MSLLEDGEVLTIVPLSSTFWYRSLAPISRSDVDICWDNRCNLDRTVYCECEDDDDHHTDWSGINLTHCWNINHPIEQQTVREDDDPYRVLCSVEQGGN